jgi:hypothetical protein
MRSRISQTILFVFFVFAEVAFECEDVGANAVEEPTVVGNHYGATGKALNVLFQQDEESKCLILSVMVTSI